MKRRDLLAATGLGIGGSAVAWYFLRDTASAAVEHPGTLDATFATNGDYPGDDDPADGFPPTFPDPPASPDVDPSTFETNDTNGESIPLVPIDVVEKWHRRGEARFVDARGVSDYENAHIYGAVSSSAESGSTGGGIEGWSTDARIVTYCGCPHHLSSMRAAGLMKEGYSRVYALDEGFGPWRNRGYPMAGTAFTNGGSADVREWTLEGSVDQQYAGEYAWARAEGSQEAAPIREDGDFTLVVKFADATDRTPVEVSTPEFSVTRALGDLSSGSIDGA